MADPKNVFVLAMVFLFALDLFAGMMVATGINETLGLTINPSGTGATDDIEDEYGDKQTTGGSTQETLFGLYNQVTATIGKLAEMINPGLSVLDNTGAPSWIFNQFLYPIATLMKGIGVAFFLRGL